MGTEAFSVPETEIRLPFFWNTRSATSNTPFPLIRTMASAPTPTGVAMAAMGNSGMAEGVVIREDMSSFGEI